MRKCISVMPRAKRGQQKAQILIRVASALALKELLLCVIYNKLFIYSYSVHCTVYTELYHVTPPFLL